MIGKVCRGFLVVALALSGGANARKAELSIDMSVGVDGSCEARIGDQSFAVTQENIDSWLPKLVPNRKTRLHLGGDYEQVPYRCVGQMIYGLQRLRYEVISFAAEPPPLDPSIKIPDFPP